MGALNGNAKEKPGQNCLDEKLEIEAFLHHFSNQYPSSKVRLSVYQPQSSSLIGPEEAMEQEPVMVGQNWCWRCQVGSTIVGAFQNLLS